MLKKKKNPDMPTSVRGSTKPKWKKIKPGVYFWTMFEQEAGNGKCKIKMCKEH